MAQRISRAKQSIKASGIPFRMPDAGERAQRLSSVLHVLYLIFSEGYTSSTGTALHRTDLSNEAIRLAREVYKLLPEDGDVAGLLALMLLTDARRAARTGPNGELIPLDEQDRTLWNRQAIAEGIALTSEALAKGSVGEYQLQAAIAAVHDEAPRAEDTDWPQILALYGMLQRLTDNPMVALNHAIATAMVNGPSAGLGVARAARPGRTSAREPSARRGTCAPAGTRRRMRRRGGAVSKGRVEDDERAGEELPAGESGALAFWSAVAAAAAFVCSCDESTYKSGSCGYRTPNWLRTTFDPAPISLYTQ